MSGMNAKMIASAPGIFRYPGGKNKPAVRSWILGHAPKSIREYREPFVGGGGVFWGMNTAESYWVNDVNPGLVAVYQALAERPHEFIAKCREIEPHKASDPMSEAGPRGGLATNARLKEVFESVKLNEDCDQAFRYFFVNRTVFGGRVNYDIPSRLYFSNAEGWDIVKTDSLERSAKKLAGVRVTCGDYRQLLSEPGDDVWIYCDPPYVVNTGLTPSSQLYQFGFTEQDHRDFADAVKASPHKIAISYDDDPDGIIRSLFPESEGFRIKRGDWKYCGTTSEEKEKGRELLILNYDPPPTLFSLIESSEDGDVNELPHHESVVKSHIGSRSFFEAGISLRSIRNGRLYRESFSTFEEYCESVFDFQRAHAYRLIASAEVIENLSPIGDKPPVIESHCRELALLPTVEQQAKAWSAAVATAEKDDVPVTASLVREHVQALLPQTDLPTEPDYTVKYLTLFKKVPEDAREDFGRFIIKHLSEFMEIKP